MTNFQAKCLRSFYDFKRKDPSVLRIVIISTPGKEGVAVETRKGEKLFYPLATIMDPIERLYYKKPIMAA